MHHWMASVGPRSKEWCTAIPRNSVGLIFGSEYTVFDVMRQNSKRLSCQKLNPGLLFWPAKALPLSYSIRQPLAPTILSCSSPPPQYLISLHQLLTSSSNSIKGASIVFAYQRHNYSGLEYDHCLGDNHYNVGEVSKCINIFCYRNHSLPMWWVVSTYYCVTQHTACGQPTILVTLGILPSYISSPTSWVTLDS